MMMKIEKDLTTFYSQKLSGNTEQEMGNKTSDRLYVQ